MARYRTRLKIRHRPARTNAVGVVLFFYGDVFPFEEHLFAIDGKIFLRDANGNPFAFRGGDITAVEAKTTQGIHHAAFVFKGSGQGGFGLVWFGGRLCLWCFAGYGA